MAAALDSYTDVKYWILLRAECATDGTDDFDINGNADLALNEAWRDLWMTQAWLCLKAHPPYALITPLPHTELTLTAAAGLNVAGVLSGVPVPAQNLVGWLFIPNTGNIISRVTVHDGGVNVTLDAVPQAYAATAGKFVQVDFTLPASFGIFAEGGFFGQDKTFFPVRGEEDLRRHYPDPPPAGLVVMGARTTKTNLRLSHYADVVRRFEAPYSIEPAIPSGGGALVIDQHLRPIFANLALYYLLLDKSDKTRADKIMALAEHKIEKALLYEERLRRGLGQEARKTTPGPYSDASTWSRQRSTRAGY